MDIIPPYLFPLVFFVALAIDRIVAARPQPVVRHWAIKGTIFFLLTAFIRTAIPAAIAGALAGHTLFDLSALGMAGGALALVLVVTLADYWFHRLAHRSDWLWRWFHQMHHSAERIDSFGAFYFSPLDVAGFTFLSSLALTLVGLPAKAVTYYFYITMFLAVIQHTNVRTPQWLGYIVQRPESHSLHHARGIHRYNYSDLPLWDVVFGTFRNPKDFMPEAGFDGASSAQIGQMLLFRDIAANDFAQSGRPARHAKA